MPKILCSYCLAMVSYSWRVTYILKRWCQRQSYGSSCQIRHEIDCPTHACPCLGLLTPPACPGSWSWMAKPLYWPSSPDHRLHKPAMARPSWTARWCSTNCRNLAVKTKTDFCAPFASPGFPRHLQAGLRRRWLSCRHQGTPCGNCSVGIESSIYLYYSLSLSSELMLFSKSVVLCVENIV